MKRTSLTTLTALIIMLLCYNAYGDDCRINCDSSRYVLDDYLSYNEYNEVNTANNALEEPESRLRRFEITFFISLPFVFIATFITLHLYGVISDPNDLNVNVWEDYGKALMGGTLIITTGIALREAIVWRDRKPEQRAAEPHDKSLSLSFTRHY